MLRQSLSIAMMLLAAAVASGAVVPVRGGSLEALEGSNTLVTVVLKSSYARDVNLTVSEVEDDLIRFTDENGTPVVYQVNDIAEVRVQHKRVAMANPLTSSPLQREDVAGAVRKAADKADQVRAASQDLMVKILASEVAGGTGSSDAIADLELDALNDDLDVAVRARESLYVLGRNPTGETLKQALHASDRAVKGAAARLAGVGGLETLRDEVFELVKDPAPKVFAGAARGCGYYHDERALPFLLRAMDTVDSQKGEATVFALSAIGGDDVLREMHTRVETASGSEWYLAVRVLYRLGDSQGIELLRGELNDTSPYAVQTALILADDDYWDANVYLRHFLESKRDTSPGAYAQRITAAALLLSKGYVQAKSYLRDVLAMEPNEIYIRGKLNDQGAHAAAFTTLKEHLCQELAVRADPSMLQLMLTAIEDQDPHVSMLAGRAIVAVSNPDCRKRIGQLN